MFLDKVNRSPYGCLLNMPPREAYSITGHVHTMTIADISQKKSIKILLLNEQDIKANNAIIQLCQNLYVWFK